MEEVALVSSEQQKFQKSIKGIKKLLKSGKIKPRTDQDARQASRFQRKGVKKANKDKGLVYISHIPHGFYENEMTQYFRQFGVVTNARVLRSARTGRSKGAAFVEFLEPAVAQIVAETMNNYLMGKRLLKAVLVPPEKQRANVFRKNWNTFQNPSSEYRRKMKKLHNENGTDEDDLKLARKQIKNVLQTKRKLKEMGIDYDFFSPVDVPLQLLPLLEVKAIVPTQVQKKLKKGEAKLKSEIKSVNVKKENLRGKKSGKVEIKKDKVKSPAKKPKFEGQDLIKIHSKNKIGKKSLHEESDNSNDSSDDSDDDFDSDEFDVAVDSDEEFESGEDEGSTHDEGDESDDDNRRSDDSKDDGDSSDEEIHPPKLTKIKHSNHKDKFHMKNNGGKSGAVPQRNGGKRKSEQKPGADKKQKKRQNN